MSDIGDLSNLRKSYEKGLISDDFKNFSPFLFLKNGLTKRPKTK